MPVIRHFYPNGSSESIVWQPVKPGRHDAFRDYSTSSLGRIILTECDQADHGGVIALFETTTQPILAQHLVVPIIELALGEAVITLEQGEEYELDIKSQVYGPGTVLFRHDPSSAIKQMH